MTKAKPKKKQTGLSVTQIADGFSVTSKTVRAWIREGLPTLEDGSKGKGNGAVIRLRDAVRWYMETRLADPAKQRARKDAAQADAYEMANEKTRGTLLDADEVAQAWSEMIANARAKLLAMPTKLSPRLVNIAEPGAISELIRIEVYAALTELSESESKTDA
jgi:phage terminase Nu1 subunit (DNA packaging protein)